MEAQLTIAAVEREVGLSKDVLRVWERRYGFPAPLRDANDERLYPADQVRRLRLVKRLMDQGHRPGRLLGRSAEELERLASEAQSPLRAGLAAPAADPETDGLLACLRAHDATGLARLLHQHLARSGLAHFVQDIVAPMATRVGEEWARGSIQVFEEHLFTETCNRALRQAIAAVPLGRAPAVLLTTAPDEPHGLGLLMVESLLTLHGARCISLGTQVPLSDTVNAAQVYGADVVALSFSSAFPARRLPEVLCQLRASLPAAVEVWAGGAAVRKLAAQEGVQLLPGLEDATAAVQAWQARH
jgi:methanogenic corrinoid protein MtbC1